MFEIMPVVGIIIIIIIIIIYCWDQYLALRNFAVEFIDGFCIFYIARIFLTVVRIPGNPDRIPSLPIYDGVVCCSEHLRKISTARCAIS